MKKIFNIALLSVFISGLYVDCIEARSKTKYQVSERKINDLEKSKRGLLDDYNELQSLLNSEYEKNEQNDKKVKGLQEKLSKLNMQLNENKKLANRQRITDEKENAFSTVAGTIAYYTKVKKDRDFKNVINALNTDKEIKPLLASNDVRSKLFIEVAKDFESYNDVTNYSSLPINGAVVVNAKDNGDKFSKEGNKDNAVNALVALKFTMALYKSMLDYNGFELNKDDIIKIYKSIVAFIEHAPRNSITIYPKMVRNNAFSSDFKKGYIWNGQGTIREFPMALGIKLNKGNTDEVYGYLKLKGVGNKLFKGGLGSISVDFFMPNSTDIKGKLGKRFYVDSSKDINEDANKKWEDIEDLQDLFNKKTNWQPRAANYPDFEIKNITLKDILRICTNGNVKCNKIFENEYTKIYIPEYIDFTGYNDKNKGDYLLNQQDSRYRYISELFKEYDSSNGTYTVVIGVIKNGKALAYNQTKGINTKNIFKGILGGIADNVNRTRKSGKKFGNKGKGGNNKTYLFDVIQNVHSVIYILTVSKDKYDQFINNAKKYDAI